MDLRWAALVRAFSSEAARGRARIMSEATQASASRSRPKPASSPTGSFPFPKFEVPAFELPKMEVPAAFREFAEKGVSQAKETYEKMMSVAEEATDVIEETYANASKGAADYGLKLIESGRVNTNAAFDFCSDLLTAKSYSEIIELSTAHARKQFEIVATQTKDLAALAQKMATETAEPIKESVSRTFSKVA
jgi:phasin